MSANVRAAATNRLASRSSNASSSNGMAGRSAASSRTVPAAFPSADAALSRTLASPALPALVEALRDGDLAPAATTFETVYQEAEHLSP